MIEANTALTVYSLLLFLGFLSVIITAYSEITIIAIITGMLDILYASYLLIDSTVYNLIWSQPIYLSNGTQLYSGGWMTYTSTFIYSPYTALMLIILGLANLLVAGKLLR